MPAMIDVARLAGVSHQTVSRVLNGHPSVRHTTRLRVRAAMQELGYRPNRAARMLATGRSHIVGVVTENTALYGPASMLAAVEHALANAGFAVSIASVPTLDGAAILGAVDRLLDQRVGGIVLITPVASANDALGSLPGDLPYVAVDGDPAHTRRVVTGDQKLGARLATQHLLDAGHRNIWHIAGPRDWYDAADRLAGWRATLHDAGVDEPPVIDADWSLAGGYRAGQMLARIADAHAVFAANDHLALGAMKALHDAGKRVPEDVSIVGFDDIPEAAYLSPALTTVRPDFAGVAALTVRGLLDQMNDHAAGNVIAPDDPVPPELVIRGSVSVARRAR